MKTGARVIHEKGERHPPLKMGAFKWRRGNYLGPRTQLSTRIRRGDPPINYSDTAAKAHDLRYSLARDKKDIRNADNKMISVMNKGIKGKKDFRVNLEIGKRGIQAKKLLEDLKIAGPTTFTTFGQVSERDKPVFERELKKLQARGFGKVRKENPWLLHVKQVQRKNPELTYKEILIKAKKTYW